MINLKSDQSKVYPCTYVRGSGCTIEQLASLLCAFLFKSTLGPVQWMRTEEVNAIELYWMRRIDLNWTLVMNFLESYWTLFSAMFSRPFYFHKRLNHYYVLAFSNNTQWSLVLTTTPPCLVWNAITRKPCYKTADSMGKKLCIWDHHWLLSNR